MTLIAAMFGFAGLVFADASATSGNVRVGPRLTATEDDSTNPAEEPQSGSLIVAAPSNDTCASPLPLTLNRVTKVDTTGAADDYQTLADPLCYSGIGQWPTTENPSGS